MTGLILQVRVILVCRRFQVVGAQHTLVGEDCGR